MAAAIEKGTGNLEEVWALESGVFYPGQGTFSYLIPFRIPGMDPKPYAC